MIKIPNTVRIACCASGQKWSPLDQPNLPPHPNQPPPPASPPPPTSSLCLISLFHFSNSLFFPPSAPSKAFLARSCNHRHSKATLTKDIINQQYKKLYFTMYKCLILISQDFFVVQPPDGTGRVSISKTNQIGETGATCEFNACKIHQGQAPMKSTKWQYKRLSIKVS